MSTDTVKCTKIIAEFDGWKHYPTPKQTGKGYWNFPEKGYSQWSLDEMKYHTSWDWLMPVVEKIEKIGLQVNITTTHTCIMWIGDSEEHTTLLSKFKTILIEPEDHKEKKIYYCFMAIVAFIKWHNLQTQPS